MAEGIHRPPDQNHFTRLNPNKMYGARNAVPNPNAGYQLTDCAYKNLTSNGKDDPILQVAQAFPNVAAHTTLFLVRVLCNPFGEPLAQLRKSVS